MGERNIYWLPLIDLLLCGMMSNQLSHSGQGRRDISLVGVSGNQEKTGKAGARASSNRGSQQPISVKARFEGTGEE